MSTDSSTRERPSSSDGFASFLADYLSRLERDGSSALAEFRRRHPEFASQLGNQMGWLAEHFRRKGQMPERIGPYRVMQRLGIGGMGEVYLAEQTTPFRRAVAVKVIKVGKHDAVRAQRFASEIQLLALLNHNGIAKLFEAGDDHGRPYFAMEYVPGKAITDYCAEERLGLAERLRLFVEVCRAVEHAHRQGILHRDLKPSNILVYGPRDEPVAKIIDFGLAKVTDPEPGSARPTQTAQFVGTPDYMSPEQVDGTGRIPVDTRADVYALGVVLYELLTGVLPLGLCEKGVRDVQEVVRAIRERQPSSPSVRVEESGSTSDTSPCACTGVSAHQLSRQLAGDLDSIVMKALAKDAEQRYGSVGQLADDLLRYLRHQPVDARPHTAPYLLRKFVRRHRAAVAFAATIAVLVAAGLVLLQLEAKERLRHLERGNLFGLAKYLHDLRARDAVPPPARPEHADELGTLLREYELLLRQAPRMRAILEQPPPPAVAPGDADAWSSSAAADVPLRAAMQETLQLLELMNRPGAEFDELRQREDWARRVHDLTVVAHATAWAQVRAEVLADEPYRFDLPPQTGLVPLGRDPTTRLQEFALLLPGGELPRRIDGRLQLGPQSCPVFVLLPGGTVQLGAQRDDPEAPRYDHEADADPLQEVELPPFFAGKHELTNGHWALALAGEHTGEPAELYEDPQRPVVDFNLDWLRHVLHAWGMRLPSSQEWEYLARGGHGEAFGAGRTAAALHGQANVLDQTAAQASSRPGEGEPEPWADGFERTAPVGSFAANGFGLFDVHGNALEPAVRSEEDGELVVELRGGSWHTPASTARILHRPVWTQGPLPSVGCRPVVSVQR